MPFFNSPSGRRSFLKTSAVGLAALAWSPPSRGAHSDRADWEQFLRQRWQRPTKLDSFAGVHPRLFLTEKRIVGVKGKVPGSHAHIWKIVLEKADGYLGKGPPADYQKQRDMREAGRGIPWQALAFLVTGERVYLENARKWILTICSFPRWQQNNSLAGGECLFGVAVGYDWLHSQFSESERTLI